MSRLTSLLIGLFVMSVLPVAQGQTFTVLHSFNGDDGRESFGGLTVDGSTLYGTTHSGGSNYCGTIFKVGTNGANFNTLYTFSSADHGAWGPNGSLILSDSTLYGTTAGGGSGGGGTVYKIGADGSGYSILHSFTYTNGALSGKMPYCGLVLNDATLYGTCSEGGWQSNHSGTIFAVGTDGNDFANLYYFTGWGAECRIV